MSVVDGLSFSEFNDKSKDQEDLDSADLTPDEESRIYGGSDADMRKNPYVAALVLDGAAYCSGTLVAPQYVLTTAICLEGIELDMRVSFGTQRGKDWGSRKAEQIRVVEAFQHPLYNSTWLTYDIALIKLEKPSAQKPARLVSADGSHTKPGTMATALGWGMVSKEKLADTLQAVDVDIISDTEGSKYVIDTDAMLCTGSKRGKLFCDRDIGAPLATNGVIMGMASGLPDDPGECEDLPGLYTRISPSLDFISDILKGGSTGNVTDSLLMTQQKSK
ncbi:hypothetical protein PInf_011375 [Phytophthora infestans]|nr:hypothetical protein PInf_011375 [Phytophthora infestans]